MGTQHTSNDTASTYVRHTVDRLTDASRKPGQDTAIWDYVHVLSILGILDAAGFGDEIRKAADDQASTWGIPTQSEVDALDEVTR